MIRLQIAATFCHARCRVQTLKLIPRTTGLRPSKRIRRMPDKVKTVWARLDKKGNLKDVRLEIFTGFKKLKIRYHAPNKRGMGRSKGNALENETAKTLSKWIYGENKILKRTPLSGGWASGKAGDVILDHEYARKKYFDPDLYVECRNYKDILQHDLLSWCCFGTPQTYGKWIKEVESKAGTRFPMIVMKGKMTKPFVMILRRWLTRLSAAKVFSASRLILLSKIAGTIYILPLKRIGRLGNAKSFFERWREDGGPTQIQRLGKLAD
jgi:hypothetical protein